MLLLLLLLSIHEAVRCPARRSEVHKKVRGKCLESIVEFIHTTYPEVWSAEIKYR